MDDVEEVGEEAIVEPESSNEMANKTGSFLCFSKQTITDLLSCILSCVIFVAVIYILLLLLNLISGSYADKLYYTVGYISLIIFITAPLGFYGSLRSSYKALFAYFVLTSYHLYALAIYIWLNARSNSFFKTSKSANNPSLELNLHQITTVAYATVVMLALVMTCVKVISTANQIEPAKVIVVDNNPLD